MQHEAVEKLVKQGVLVPAAIRVTNQNTKKSRLMGWPKRHLIEAWERAGYQVTTLYEQADNVKVRGDGPAPPARRPSGEAAPRPEC